MTIKETIMPGFSTVSYQHASGENSLLRSRSRWLVGLFLAATFGLLSMIFGLGLSVMLWAGIFSERANPEITILLGASFPLLFFAAHCLDKIREAENRVKIEYRKRFGTFNR